MHVIYLNINRKLFPIESESEKLAKIFQLVELENRDIIQYNTNIYTYDKLYEK